MAMTRWLSLRRSQSKCRCRLLLPMSWDVEGYDRYFLSLLGGNFTSEEDMSIGLPSNYYPYKLGYDANGRKVRL